MKRLGGLLGLLGEKHGVDVGENTAGSDGDAADEVGVRWIVLGAGLKRLYGRTQSFKR